MWIPEEPDWEAMDAAALRDYLTQLREQLAELDAAEPPVMEGEGYEVWAERHEALEDLADEAADRLDDLA